jgi:CHAD domain-containing protein
MPFKLRPQRSTKNELRRILEAECKAAGDVLERGEGDWVHDARTHIKKARAMIRMVAVDAPEEYDVLADCLKEAAHELTALRETDANLQTLDELTTACPLPDGSANLARVALRQEQNNAATNGHSAIAQAKEALARAQDELPGAVAAVGGPKSTVRGLTKSYRRARRAGRGLDPHTDATQIHEWRKRVKDLTYQCRLFKERSRAAGRRADKLAELGDVLGRHHNLETLRIALRAPASDAPPEPEIEAILGCIDGQEVSLATQALELARPLFRLSPKTFRRQSRAWARRH